MQFPSELRVKNQHIRKYFFQKGNKFSRGRPPKNKTQIERIRSRILRVLNRRVMHETDLDSVSTTDLLKFFASIMPKENLTHQATQVNYISNVPREDEQLKVEDSSVSSIVTIPDLPPATLTTSEATDVPPTTVP